VVLPAALGLFLPFSATIFFNLSSLAFSASSSSPNKSNSSSSAAGFFSYFLLKKKKINIY
jgi:hypothetical protein